MKEVNSIIKQIFDIYRNSINYIGPKTAQFQIGRGQWYFLNSLLLEEDGLSQEELSDKLSVDKAHTARAIKKLEEAGYVLRRPDKKDGRKKNVFVTEKALEIKSEYASIYEDLNDVLVKGFEKKELLQFKAFLDKISENMAATN